MSIVILSLLRHYIPGYKAGGPLRSMKHLVERLGDTFDFRVVTLDRDFGESQAFAAVAPGRWAPVGNGEALYLPPRQLGAGRLRRVISGTPHDVLYLNSLFDPRMALMPLLLRRLRLIPSRPTVLAPRGELHPGALGTGGWPRWVPSAAAARLGSPKQLKKRLYIAACRALGLYRGLTWHASTPLEAEDIRRVLGRGVHIMVAPDLSALPPTHTPPRTRKRAGLLRATYFSRIDAKKNLHALIPLLGGLDGRVELDIYGPVCDRRYWARCEAAIARLPEHVVTRYHGSVPHEWVREVFRTHDLFVLPTLGENYGHAVLEALVHGCPVLVSDRTPWRGLAERGVGWDVPLERPDEIRALLQRCVDMDEGEWSRWAARAAAYGHRCCADEGPVDSNRELFRHAAAAWQPRPRAAAAGGSARRAP